VTRRHLLLQAALPSPTPSHIVTLSFDDGFDKSFRRIAAIHEEFGLRACLNVIALGHFPDFRPTIRGLPDPMVPFPKAGFDLWNRLRERGHEVMPHTYDHANLTTLPLPEARLRIELCIEYFREHLANFHPAQSVYSFAYNASNPDLDAYALSRFLAIRTGGPSMINPIPAARRPTRIACRSFGPGNADAFVQSQLDQFLAGPGGWWVFNAHGLDDEGWGPLSSPFLRATLARLSRLPHVAVLPAGEVLLRLHP